MFLDQHIVHMIGHCHVSLLATLNEEFHVKTIKIAVRIYHNSLLGPYRIDLICPNGWPPFSRLLQEGQNVPSSCKC